MSDQKCGCCKEHPILELSYDALRHRPDDDAPVCVCPKCDCMDRWPVNKPKA